MIQTEAISPSVLKIVPTEKLKEVDFHTLTPQVDAMIAKLGPVRLLIDASGFNGWESFAAFQAHASFIKKHQGNVERLGIIVAHDWQHWLVDAVRMFLHPKAQAFDKPRSRGAKMGHWVLAPGSAFIADG